MQGSERELGKMREEGWWRARMTAIVAPIKISVKELFAKKIRQSILQIRGTLRPALCPFGRPSSLFGPNPVAFCPFLGIETTI